MGPAGSGKSTLGAALAQQLQLPFVEGDTLHSARSLQKMQRGEPLDDADRGPWLAAVAAQLADAERTPRGLIITCSALKQAYRQRLRESTPGVRFIFLDVPQEVAERRVAERASHFLPARLVATQFATLERPTPQEHDVMTVQACGSAAATLAAVLRALAP